MLSGTTCNALAIAGSAVLRIVVSSDSMKNATATSHGSTRFADTVRAGVGIGRRGVGLRRGGGGGAAQYAYPRRCSPSVRNWRIVPCAPEPEVRAASPWDARRAIGQPDELLVDQRPAAPA